MKEISKFLDLSDEKQFPLKSDIKEMEGDFLVESEDSQISLEETHSSNSKAIESTKIDSDVQENHENSQENKPLQSEHTENQNISEKQITTLSENEVVDTEDNQELPKSSKYNAIEVQSNQSQDQVSQNSENVMFGDEAFGETSKSQPKVSQPVQDVQSQENLELNSQNKTETVQEDLEVRPEDPGQESASISQERLSSIDKDEDDQNSLEEDQTQTQHDTLNEKEQNIEEQLAKDIVKEEESQLQKQYQNDVDEQNKALSIPHGHDFNSDNQDQPLLPNNHIDEHPMMENPYNNQETQTQSDYSFRSDEDQENNVQEQQSDHSLSEMAEKLNTGNQIDIDHVISLPLLDPYQSQKGSSHGVYSKAFTNIEQGVKQTGNEGLIERNYLIQKFGAAQAQQIAAKMQDHDNQRFHQKVVIPVVDMSEAYSSHKSSSCSDAGIDHHAEGINVENMMALGNTPKQQDVDLDGLLNDLESHAIGSFQKGTMGTGKAILMRPGIVNQQISQGSYASGQRVPLHIRLQTQHTIPVITAKSVKQMMTIDPQPVYSRPIFHIPIKPKVPCPPQNPFNNRINVPQVYHQPIQIYRKTPQYFSPVQIPIPQQMKNLPSISDIESSSQYNLQDPRDEYLDSQDSLIDSMLSGGMMKKERRLSLVKNKKKTKKKMKKVFASENLRSKVSSGRKLSLAQRRRKLSQIKHKHSYEHLYRGNHKKSLTLKRKLQSGLSEKRRHSIKKRKYSKVKYIV